MHKKIIAAAVAAGFGLAGSAFAADNSVEVLHWWTSGGEAAALNVLKEQPREAGREVERHAGRRRRRRAGDDGAARTGDRRQSAHRRADARLRHHRLGQAGRGGRPERGGGQGRLGQGGAGRAAEVLQVQRQVDRLAGERPLDQLGLGQQGGAGEGRGDDRAEDLGRVHRRRREGAEGRLHRASRMAGSPGRTPPSSTAWRCPPAASSTTARRSSSSIPRRSTRRPRRRCSSACRRCASWSTRTSPGRDWNVASGMVISGKAGFQMMGDWAKGEFINAKKVPGKDFLCFRTPGSQGMVSFNSDQFVMFKVSADKSAAQLLLASDVMNPNVPVGVQRGEGLGAGAHRRARHRLRRLRQEGHEGPGRGQPEEHAGRLHGARPCGAGVDQERDVRRHHPPLQRRARRQEGDRGARGRPPSSRAARARRSPAARERRRAAIACSLRRCAREPCPSCCSAPASCWCWCASTATSCSPSTCRSPRRP